MFGCSAYRLSPTLVTVLGLTPMALRGRHTGQGCAWQWEDGERVEGELQVLNEKDHHHYLVSAGPLPPGKMDAVSDLL